MTNLPKIVLIEGKAVPVRGNDIDTDRIIPARFMKTVTFEGLGKFAFYDERFDDKGNKKNHSFNEEKFSNASILLVNKNFGCGSSREHAPQAIMRYGIKAIIGESFAEIFAGNCTMLGIPTLRVSEKDINELMTAVEENPKTFIKIDLIEKKISFNGKFLSFEIPENARKNFIEGTWDTVAQLLSKKNEIEQIAKTLPYLKGF